jgi:hypothetical protein
MAGILKLEYEALGLTALVKYRDYLSNIVNTMMKFGSVGGGKCLHQLSDCQF